MSDFSLDRISVIVIFKIARLLWEVQTADVWHICQSVVGQPKEALDAQPGDVAAPHRCRCDQRPRVGTEFASSIMVVEVNALCHA